MRKREVKLRRVTWAPDAMLSQVKLFVPDDCPAQVAIVSDSRLQAKTANMIHPDAIKLDDVPPGFEANTFSSSLKKKHPIAQVKWSCPLKFVLNENLRVAAGEESEESVAQTERELRTLEAFYPRLSSIPPSPCVSLDVEACDYDDRRAPIIPIIPIEEADAMNQSDDVKLLTDAMEVSKSGCPILIENYAQADFPCSTRPPVLNKPSLGMLAGAGADTSAAASAAFTALIKTKELGSMIDTDLLIKILSEPKMIELLKNLRSSDRAKETSKPPASASFATLFKSNGQESMIDTNLLIRILSDPKMVELLKGVGSFDRVKTTAVKPPAKTTLMPGLNETTLDPMIARKPVQSMLSALPNSGPEWAQSIRFSRMERQNFSFTKPTDSKQHMLPPAVQKTSDIFPILDTRNIMSVKSPTVNSSIPLNTVHRSSNTLRAKPEQVPLLNSLSSTENPSRGSPVFVSKPMKPFHGHKETAFTSKPGTGYVGPTAVSSFATSTVAMFTRSLDAIPATRTTNGWTSPTLHPGCHGSQPPPSQARADPLQATKVAVIKDTDYYKNLIKQHGTERQETVEGHGPKQRTRHVTEWGFDDRHVNANNRKSCAYFNSDRGCRKGLSCPYQHDPFFLSNGGGFEEARSMKRMKLMPRGIAESIHM